MDIRTDVVVVVPTIRETNIREFLAAWQFPCPVIVIEDNPTKTFAIEGVAHYAWDDIDGELGEDSWIIPRRSDCVRSYGYLKAYQTGAAVIVTLDDDCLPGPPYTLDDLTSISARSVLPMTAERFLAQHIDNLQPKRTPRWASTLDGVYPRGVPYEARDAQQDVAISHGLWTGTLDWDSLSQLHYGRAGAPHATPNRGLIQRGFYYPMCGMNLAWRREYTVLLYFLLQGSVKMHGGSEPRPIAIDRFGDIWAGILSKKVLDHLGIGVWSGNPTVFHSRASNVWANFKKEHAGLMENEHVWRDVDAVQLTGTTPDACYGQLADTLVTSSFGYWQQTAKAMQVWRSLL